MLPGSGCLAPTQTSGMPAGAHHRRPVFVEEKVTRFEKEIRTGFEEDASVDCHQSTSDSRAVNANATMSPVVSCSSTPRMCPPTPKMRTDPGDGNERSV